MMMRSRTVAWRKLRFRFDWTLTLAMLAMVALGLVNLWSALQDRGPHLFSKQISLLALGLGVFLAVAALDYRAISRIGPPQTMVGMPGVSIGGVASIGWPRPTRFRTASGCA